MASLPRETPDRLQRIAQARQQTLQQTSAPGNALVEPWIARSWERCLALGLAPSQRVAFAAVSSAMMRRTEEANRALVLAARPVLEQLGRAMMDTRYFAILTNQHGVVVDAHGAIDHSDRRADLITRIGADLSESSVGTTAIGAALSELAPVWLHRGEHFFDDTSVYSCAGAPLFGPHGHCVGMLDLTGVQAVERPELRHLVVQSARSIENALALAQSHTVLLRLNWPGCSMGDETDGLVGLDADGGVTSANPAARQLLPQLSQPQSEGWHSRDLFALAFEKLFDAARRDAPAMEVPLWSGLRLQLLARRSQPNPIAMNSSGKLPVEAAPTLQLKDVETALIRKAVRDAKGNVAQAALLLGISRATVYRRLGQGGKPG